MKEDKAMIREIIKRPGMYLGENSITKFMTFINGYNSALSLNHLYEFSYVILPLSFEFFYAFVRIKYKEKRNISTQEILLSQEQNNEERAFKSFISLFEEFECIEIKGYQYIKLNDDNINFHEKNKKVPCYINDLHNFSDQTPIYKGAIGFYIITLKKSIGYLLVIEYEDCFCVEDLFGKKERIYSIIESCFGQVDFGKIIYGKDLTLKKIIYTQKVYWQKYIRQNIFI